MIWNQVKETDTQVEELNVIDTYDDAKKLYDCKEDLLDYMMKVSNHFHLGDNHIKLPLILSYAATRIENCGGIHGFYLR